MVGTISFRPITEEDQPLLLKIYGSTREEELRLVDWDDAQKQAFVEQQFHAQHTHYQKHFPQARYDVVLVDDTPAGRIYVDRRSDEIRLMDIALLPEYRNQGIGGSLLGDLMEAAATEGKTLTACVERNNRAMVFYERLGFRNVGETDMHFLMQWTPENTPAGE